MTERALAGGGATALPSLPSAFPVPQQLCDDECCELISAYGHTYTRVCVLQGLVACKGSVPFPPDIRSRQHVRTVTPAYPHLLQPHQSHFLATDGGYSLSSDLPCGHFKVCSDDQCLPYVFIESSSPKRHACHGPVCSSQRLLALLRTSLRQQLPPHRCRSHPVLW